MTKTYSKIHVVSKYVRKGDNASILLVAGAVKPFFSRINTEACRRWTY